MRYFLPLFFASFLSAASLPLAFEPNVGQADARARFVARGDGYRLWLTPGEAVVAGAHSVEGIRMSFPGASRTPAVTGSGELAGKINYLVGRDPSRWRTGVPTFSRVRYSGVYPGIDVEFYGNQREFEFDFTIAPGAEAKSIRLRKPVAYQIIDGVRQEVACRFALTRNREVALALVSYDRRRPLVVDPGLGMVQRPVPSGGIPPSPPPETTLRPQVRIAGRTATVSYSGVAPNFAGLYQINAEIPADTPPGSQPLLIAIGGIESNTVTLAVR